LPTKIGSRRPETIVNHEKETPPAAELLPSCTNRAPGAGKACQHHQLLVAAARRAYNWGKGTHARCKARCPPPWKWLLSIRVGSWPSYPAPSQGCTPTPRSLSRTYFAAASCRAAAISTSRMRSTRAATWTSTRSSQSCTTHTQSRICNPVQCYCISMLCSCCQNLVMQQQIYAHFNVSRAHAIPACRSSCDLQAPMCSDLTAASTPTNSTRP
jgi:hypothetical protein